MITRRTLLTFAGLSAAAMTGGIGFARQAGAARGGDKELQRRRDRRREKKERRRDRRR